MWQSLISDVAPRLGRAETPERYQRSNDRIALLLSIAKEVTLRCRGEDTQA
jgi:hypothetical protein